MAQQGTDQVVKISFGFPKFRLPKFSRKVKIRNSDSPQVPAAGKFLLLWYSESLSLSLSRRCYSVQQIVKPAHTVNNLTQLLHVLSDSSSLCSFTPPIIQAGFFTFNTIITTNLPILASGVNTPVSTPVALKSERKHEPVAAPPSYEDVMDQGRIF